jgi:hypothetical protein
VLDAGVMVEGYEGGLARTEGADATVARAALDALKEACRPGVTGGELARAAPNPDLLPAYGIGLGVEPLSTEVGATLCLQVLVDGVLLRETLVMRPDGVEPVSG